MQVPTSQAALLLLLGLLAIRKGAAQQETTTMVSEEAAQERSGKILDHVVTKEQASKAAFQFDPAKLGVSDEVGCGKCSLQERMYCVSDAVLNDHCCCDKHIEPMPFVPHKCYIKLPPAAPCMPIAGNCAQYSRIFDCCCKHILQQRFPTRQNHHGWLASMFNLMGLNWSEHEPADDPVPVRPLPDSSYVQGSYRPPYMPFGPFGGQFGPPSGSAAAAQSQSQSNYSYTLSDDVSQFYSPNKTNKGHNKLVSGAHMARGGLAALLLATLAMLLFR